MATEVGQIHPYFLDAGTQHDIHSVNQEYCGLFEFILKVVFTGTVCLIGFGTNTVCFVNLWKERQISPTTFLIQAIVIADFAVIWMLFVGDSMPALGYVLPVLRQCTTVCGYVKAVTRPLLFLAHVCVVWFTLLTTFNRYVVMCRPTQVSLVCTVDYARKKVILTIIFAVMLTLPMTFDSALTLTYQVQDSKNNATITTIQETLAENKWYQLIYINILTFFVVYAIPLVGLTYLALRLWFILASLRRLRRAVAPMYRTQHMDTTQVSMTLAIVLVICYLPLITLKGVEWADTHNGELHNHTRCGKLQYYLATFSGLFLAINSSLKLLILGLFSPSFVRQLHSYSTCGCCGSKQEDLGNKSLLLAKHRDPSVLDNMYRCADMSEMTLISHVDSRP